VAGAKDKPVEPAIVSESGQQASPPLEEKEEIKAERRMQEQIGPEDVEQMLREIARGNVSKDKLTNIQKEVAQCLGLIA
jgi:hypothetical protein